MNTFDSRDDYGRNIVARTAPPPLAAGEPDVAEHAELTTCVRETLYTLKLPAPEAGGTVVVDYPFVFTSLTRFLIFLAMAASIACAVAYTMTGWP